VLFFFLRDPRYPVVVSMAIPASVLATFALLEASGVSLNIMSLGGLALGVGMLVDNSIVVLENIFRHRELGRSPIEAAAVGAEEVTAPSPRPRSPRSACSPDRVRGGGGRRALPRPVARDRVLPDGVAARRAHAAPRVGGALRGRGGPGVGRGRRVRSGRGRDRRPAPALHPRPRPRRATGRRALAVARGALALVGQLLAFWFHGIGGVVRRAATPVLDRFDRAYARFAHHYHIALEWALDRPWQTLGWSALALVATLAVGLNLRRDLLPDVDQGAFEVRIQLPEGSDLDAAAAATTTVEEALRADPGVEAVFSRIGRDVRAYGEGEERSDLNTALLQVRVRPRERTARVIERVRPATDRIPGANVTMQAGQATTLGRILGGEAADIAVRVRSEDLDSAHARAEAVAARLARVDRLANVRVGTERGTPEIRVEVLRDRAAAYGIDPRAVVQAVERAMRGQRATEFVDFDRKIAVMVRYPEDLRYSRSTLETLRVEGIPLRELVSVEEVLGPAEVRREDQGRVVTVFADVTRGGLDAAIGSVQDALRDLPASRDVRMEVGGENEEMRRSFRGLLFAFLLASAIVYMVLAAQFESFVHPFTILMRCRSRSWAPCSRWS
jgi:HAE1 family hydrophobic/amphiphilic exporter-1